MPTCAVFSSNALNIGSARGRRAANQSVRKPMNSAVSRVSPNLRRALFVTVVGLSPVILIGACGGDESESAGPPVEITLKGESELFPSLNYSTGLLPDGSPIQASFT